MTQRENFERLAHELEVHQIELETQNAELREVRSRLEHSLQNFVEFFQWAPVPYLVIESTGTVSQINHRALLLLGTEEARIVGSKMSERLPVRSAHQFYTLWDSVRNVSHEDDESLSCETTIFVTRKKMCVIDVKMTARTFEQNGESLLLLALEDVTERKQYEKARRDNEQALLQADRNKNDFLATLSHELRNPLSPICNSLEVLQQSSSDSHTRERALGTVYRQVDHLCQLVDELLDVSRISRGKVRLTIKRVNLTQLVTSVFEDYRGLCQSRGIELHLEADSLVWVDGDSARLVQVTSNILSNAVKFTPRGGRITAQVTVTDGSAYVVVDDTGSGFDEELLEHLFKPFYQGQHGRGGLGLGLSTVRGLVELQQGSVQVQSAGTGRGTQVVVRLPLKPQPPQAAPAGPSHHGEPRRLVVIDDNIDAADSLRDLLVNHGHDVEVAYDGATGFRLVQKFLPQAVICDIGMPVMDGYSVAQVIKSHEDLRKIHLVALTGYGHVADVERVKSSGFDRHLVKPCSAKSIVAALNFQ